MICIILLLNVISYAQEGDYNMPRLAAEVIDFSLDSQRFNNYKMQKLAEELYDGILGATILVEGNIGDSSINYDRNLDETIVAVVGEIGSRAWKSEMVRRHKEISNQFTNLTIGGDLEDRLSRIFQGGTNYVKLGKSGEASLGSASGDGYSLTIRMLIHSKSDRLAMEIDGPTKISAFGKINNLSFALDGHSFILTVDVTEISINLNANASSTKEQQTYTFSSVVGKRAWLKQPTLTVRIGGLKTKHVTNVTTEGRVVYRGTVQLLGSTIEADSPGAFVRNAPNLSSDDSRVIPTGAEVKIVDSRNYKGNTIIDIVDNSGNSDEIFFLTGGRQVSDNLQDSMLRAIFEF
jgi:hypothetical protein